MPIVVAPLGEELRVVRIATDEKTKKHLESLGITINSVIKILSAAGGSVICLVKNVRLALDKNVAVKIFAV